jgi:TfoX/Sxy family transcriptional regulator of competence genes
MAFDEALAIRVRELVAGNAGIAEKRMFGGLAFILNGNMSVGVHGNELIVRIEPAETEEALKEPGVRIFDITGRPMKGWLLVASGTVSKQRALSKWVSRSVSYAASLPGKAK